MPKRITNCSEGIKRAKVSLCKWVTRPSAGDTEITFKKPNQKKTTNNENRLKRMTLLKS